MKNMDDHIAEIKKHPLAGVEPFLVPDFDLLLLHGVDHMMGDGAHVTVGIAVHDDEIMGDIRQFAQIQDDRRFPLFIEREFPGK